MILVLGSIKLPAHIRIFPVEPAEASMKSEYIDTAQAKREYPLSASYLAKLRMSGEGPEFIKIGRRVFYSRQAIEVWLSSHRRRSTSDIGEY
jgi:hypothetical protein